MLLVVAALVLGEFVMFPGPVETYQGDPNARVHNRTPERRGAMTQAFENNDYNA